MKNLMRVRGLYLKRISIYGGLRFNVKNLHDFLKIHMTL